MVGCCGQDTRSGCLAGGLALRSWHGYRVLRRICTSFLSGENGKLSNVLAMLRARYRIRYSSKPFDEKPQTSSSHNDFLNHHRVRVHKVLS